MWPFCLPSQQDLQSLEQQLQEVEFCTPQELKIVQLQRRIDGYQHDLLQRAVLDREGAAQAGGEAQQTDDDEV